ncbi:Acetyl-coenzyme A transporter 1 [Schistosoma japonicum]|nr:Acetyl-coenzyme A transporter 1 [Schistosoma japonicum]KAH8855035.1 Acetyl-coenzyme A transporter 1 [Schistosoma japonicum]
MATKKSSLTIDSSSVDKYYINEKSGKEQSDFCNICLLMSLYVLQGIPLGLSYAVPYILQSDPKTVNYQSQAAFSFAFWPFSLKLAWAPIVDSLYSSRIGRRKTWLLPVQYALGINMLIIASYVNQWLGRTPDNPWGPLGVTHPVDISSLTVAFFGLTFLAATQDIVVDGWALTMLSRKNLGWASTCNTVGQTLGHLIAFVLLICLESPYISNMYIRLTPVEGEGLISFSGFLYFWGIVFLVTTTLVGILKKERTNYLSDKSPNSNHLDNNPNGLLTYSSNQAQNTSSQLSISRNRTPLLDVNDKQSGESFSNTLGFSHIIQVNPHEEINATESNEELSLLDTYRVMLGICKLKPVLRYILFLFIVKVCFCAADTISGLKLIDQGLPKEKLVFIGILLLPLEVILPLFITKITNGPRVLKYFTWAVLPRLFLASLSIPLVYFAPYFKISSHIHSDIHISNQTLLVDSPSVSPSTTTHTSFSWILYGTIICHMAAYTVFSTTMFITQVSFNARISDPAVGGTYMTLLNTAANLATSLPNTLFLSLVEPLTLRTCSGADILKAGLLSLQNNSIKSMNTINVSHQIQYSDDEIYRNGHRWLSDNATCRDFKTIQACLDINGTCSTILDGFYVEVGLCVLFGLLTFPTVVLPFANHLDSQPKEAYTFRLSPKSSTSTREKYQKSVKSQLRKVRKE